MPDKALLCVVCITFDIVSLSIYILKRRKQINTKILSPMCLCFDSFAVVFLYHPDWGIFFFSWRSRRVFVYRLSTHFFFFCLVFVSTKCTQDPSLLYEKGKEEERDVHYVHMTHIRNKGTHIFRGPLTAVGIRKTKQTNKKEKNTNFVSFLII